MPKSVPISEVDGKKFVEWLALLKEGDPSIREEAMRALVYFPGPHGGELITQLLDRCQDPDASLRVRAIMALTVLEVRKDEISRIVKAMGVRVTQGPGPFGVSEPQVVVRFQAALALVRFGEDARDAITGLLKGMDDTGSFEVRRMCIRALEQCGYTGAGPAPGMHPPPDPRVTAALHNSCRAAHEPASLVHLEAVIALGSMGKSADPMLQKKTEDVLVAMIGHRDRSVAIWAMVSLVALDYKDPRLTTEAIVAKLAEFLQAKDQRTRLQAVRALGLVHFRSAKVLPRLMPLLEDKDPAIVAATITTIASFGKDAMPAIEKLTAISKKKDSDTEKTLAAIAEAAIKHIKDVKDVKDVKDPK
jgi:HEAT repeat protein